MIQGAAEVAGVPPAPTYLTAEEVGQMLQVSGKSVYRWLKDDPTMPVLKIGGTVRFPRERLERWLRDREQGAARRRHAPAAVSRPAAGREART
ncbi:MAG: helix-turn-helix domain-containing protein [Candidatus Rokubacteria bacterium]|nr:helix-turn-helix domain-containing protein [Candidatus Rokubacteria bacterium]MBI3109308.1 helix-turn-helix domain-containing protein [Candidatus Rokubacteria bacterium]